MTNDDVMNSFASTLSDVQNKMIVDALINNYFGGLKE
jgi:hypothetical protein